MKFKNIIRIACIGAALYGVYRSSAPSVKDYSDLDFSELDSIDSDEKTGFREKLEADLKEAEKRYL